MQKRAARRGVRALAFLLCLLMVVSLLPVMGVNAAEAGDVGPQPSEPVTVDGLQMSKKLELTSDGTYTITLEAFATGETTTVTQKSGEPLDIVLVLDQSGSMKEHLDDLKDAVKQFVKTITDNAKEYNVDHRIAVVGFAGANRDKGDDDEYYYANSELFIGSNQYNYIKNGKESTYNKDGNLASDHYKEAFQSVTDSTGATNLTNAIDNLAAKGGTHPDVGFNMANGILNANPARTYEKADGTTATCKRIVVMFTDGTPGETKWDADVANDTIETAYETKHTYGATVYTVGLLDDPSTDVTNFMNYVSSNYPDAQSMSVTTSDEYTPVYSSDLNTSKTYYVYTYGNYYEVTYSRNAWSTNWNSSYTPKTSSSDNNRNHTQFYEKTALESTGGPGNKVADKYYMTTSNSAELEKIFNNISQDSTSTTASANLDANAILKDVISAGFDVTDATTVSADSYKVTTTDGKNYSTGNKGEKYEVSFAEKTVSVTGFDYAEKCVTTKKAGEKIQVIITGLIPNTAGDKLYSNDNEKSGIYEDGTKSEPFAPFEKPYTKVGTRNVVLDFSMTANIATVGGVKGNERVSTHDYGNFTYGENNLTYKLKTRVADGNLVFDGIDSALYFGHAYGDNTATNAWNKVNVIPANNVYYDDDLLDSSSTFTDGDYGYDVAVENAANNTADIAKGSKKVFTFTGTGIDLYCTTKSDSGSVFAQLRKVNDDNSLSVVPGVNDISMNDTYESGTLYNVPTISFRNLESGKYQVTLYTDKTVDYQLDGVRVYNPGNADVETLYNADEKNATFTKVRDLLLEANSFNDGDASVTGVVYTDQIREGSHNTTAIDTYEKVGPKNEVYLATGNAIAFKVDNYQSGMKVMVGLSAPAEGQNAGEVTMSNGSEKAPTDVNSAVDMYYNVTPNADGYVVIENTGSSLISVTNVKLSGAAAVDATALSVDDGLLTYMASFDTLEVTEPAPVEPEPTPETPANNTVSAIIHAIWAQVKDSIGRLFGRL